MPRAVKKAAPGAVKAPKTPRTSQAKVVPIPAEIARAPSARWQRSTEYEIASLHDDEGIYHAQRVHDGVRALAKNGRIGGAEVAAAGRWVMDYERSMRSSYCEPATAGVRGSGTNVGPEMRLAGGVDASTRYRQARQAVELVGDALLRAFVHHGRSLRALEELMGGDRRQLATELVATLRMLVDHYCHIDRHGHDGMLRPCPVASPVTLDRGMAA